MYYESVREKLNEFEIVGESPKTIFLLPELAMEEIYHFIVTNNLQICLELGSGYGATSCVMAAAANYIGGKVTTLDLALHQGANAQLLKEHVGLDNLEVIADPLGYNWYMADLIRERTKDDICEPLFDFVFLDGAHEWLPDALAVTLVIKLLKPGGWIVLDDINFNLRSMPHWKQTHGDRSDRELDTFQVEMVYDLILRQHPQMTNFQLSQSGRLGWAQKKIASTTNPPKKSLIKRTIEVYKHEDHPPLIRLGAVIRKTIAYIRNRLSHGSGSILKHRQPDSQPNRAGTDLKRTTPLSYSLPSSIMTTTGTNVGPMLRGKILTQYFTCTHDGLSALSLFVATYLHQINSTANLKIIKLENQQVLREVIISTVDFQDNSWQRFEFTPIEKSAGEKFILQFETDGYIGSNGISEAITIWANDTFQGICQVDNNFIREAICFRCHYTEPQVKNN